MKIPKTFIPNKDLEETIEMLLLEKPDTDNYDKKTVSMLLRSCSAFTKQRNNIHPYLEDIYQLGGKLANMMPHFAKDDLEELSKRITAENCQDMYLGFYISALINKIVTENDMVTLRLDVELYGIGAYQKKGTTTVKGDLGYFAGHFLEGATLIVEGNTGNRTGNGMKMGRIVITGEAGEDTGDFMKGGEIITYGRIKSVSSSCHGTIYSEGKRLR
jgi:formylmethanofuran dehydrogenase subunit C